MHVGGHVVLPAQADEVPGLEGFVKGVWVSESERHVWGSTCLWWEAASFKVVPLCFLRTCICSLSFSNLKALQVLAPLPREGSHGGARGP